jgi:hypothetical protein
MVLQKYNVWTRIFAPLPAANPAQFWTVLSETRVHCIVCRQAPSCVGALLQARNNANLKEQHRHVTQTPEFLSELAQSRYICPSVRLPAVHFRIVFIFCMRTSFGQRDLRKRLPGTARRCSSGSLSWTKRPGFDYWQRQLIFSFSLRPDWSWGPCSLQRVPKVKLGMRCDPDHSPPSGVEVKKE